MATDARTRSNDKIYDRRTYLACLLSSKLENGDLTVALRLLCFDDVIVEDSPRVMQ